jgi:ubiquinone/menaquinone biosynthesis C-methylase UbiE
MSLTVSDNEQQVNEAFSKQSAVFDNLYSSNTILKYKRERVRNHLLPLLGLTSEILELNSGTGEDAIWLSSRVHSVHATDISSAMQTILIGKVRERGLQNITTEICSFTTLDKLKTKGPYDLIFSNFAGLNCTGELKQVLHSFPDLLKPGGKIVLVLLPSFCLWESLLFIKGKWKTAFRRFFSSQGRRCKLEGIYFRCWYYNPSYIIGALKESFSLLELEGLCSLVPPSYIENFAEKHPVLYEFLKRKEDGLKTSWPWRSVGDYYIISLQKKTS